MNQVISCRIGSSVIFNMCLCVGLIIESGLGWFELAVTLDSVDWSFKFRRVSRARSFVLLCFTAVTLHEVMLA